MTPKFKTALFAGSFNPFTTGHASIVERTLSICDRVVIGVGVNIDKPDDLSKVNFEHIKAIYAGDDRVDVRKYDILTIDFARQCGADFMVRGVRNAADFEYEKNLAEINRHLSGMETVLMPALPELSMVSSSMVRELEKYGKDVSEFLPILNKKSKD